MGKEGRGSTIISHIALSVLIFSESELREPLCHFNLLTVKLSWKKKPLHCTHTNTSAYFGSESTETIDANGI